MSNIWGTARQVEEQRSVPRGDAIGSYTSYLDAQKAVDYLADHQFPVQHVSIVGNDLKMVERVTGRLSYPRVALNGALTGVWFGLLIGMLLSFFGSGSAQGGLSILASVIMGAAFWMLFGIVTYAMQRGKRDFTSTNQVLASSYDVIVSSEVAAEARRLLQQLPMDAAAGPRPPYGRDFRSEQPPQRPAGWEDPYARGSRQDAQPQETAPREEPTAAPTPRGQFPDLPDGRPQYGVRVDRDRQPRQVQSEQAGSLPERQERADGGRPEDERPHDDGPRDDGPRDDGRGGTREEATEGGVPSGLPQPGRDVRPPSASGGTGASVPDEPQAPYQPVVPDEPQGMPEPAVPEEPQLPSHPQRPAEPPVEGPGTGRPGSGTGL